MKLFDQVLSGRKGHLNGTHRLVSPEETLMTYGPRCAELGITRLANLTGLDFVGIPVVQAVRPNSRNLSVSQGKGLTLAAAKASAMMECIEGWHAEELLGETRFEPLRTLRRREAVVDVERIPHKQPWTRAHEDLALAWVLGFDIMRDQPTWVPWESVSLDRTQPPTRALRMFTKNSSGLASGNQLAEAVLHGLCEVIEHDAYALWTRTRGDGLGSDRLVDLSTVDDAACRKVITRFERAGLSLAVHDLTSNIGVPTYGCMAIDNPDAFHSLGFSWGQGCHPAPAIALLRALTEAAQSRLTLIAGSRDDIGYELYMPDRRRRWASGLTAGLRASTPRLSFHERASLAGETFEADLARVTDRLSAVGCESAVVVDLSRPELGVPVVRVFVPGLEGVPGECLPGARAA